MAAPTFSVDTALAGSFNVGIPSDMGEIIGGSCHLFASLLSKNKGARAAGCVTKAAFNFDPAEAARDACDVIKNNVPNIGGPSWPVSLGQRRLALHQLGG